MKLDVINLDGSAAGEVEVTDAIFDLEPRADILHRVVRWQRNKFGDAQTCGIKQFQHCCHLERLWRWLQRLRGRNQSRYFTFRQALWQVAGLLGVINPAAWIVSPALFVHKPCHHLAQCAEPACH